MQTDQFLTHHGIATNPFAEEDAQTDQVFRSHCADVHHPAWDKVYGDPASPATSIVFGEKGSGKTAIRLQIAEAIRTHNETAPAGERLWVVEYDDFNPLLDHFADRLSARKQRDPRRVLAEWKLWDHMDGILSIAVTRLVDHLLGTARLSDGVNQVSLTEARRKLDRSQKRDLLLLAACYDDSTDQPLPIRWRQLRRKLRYSNWSTNGWFLLGVATLFAVLGALLYFQAWSYLATPWPYVAAASAWIGWSCKWWKRHRKAGALCRNVRVLRRDRGTVRDLLMGIRDSELDGQPLPTHRRTDDRYELFGKLRALLRSLGAGGIVVLVDRVDEPHLTGGRVERMRDFVWSLLDNKFLKQPGVGIKLLLPAELYPHLQRERDEFHQRARIDKQNVVPSLDWSGEALADLANARMAGCAVPDRKPQLRSLISPAVSDERLRAAIGSLRTPRHLFKFLFRLISTHCSTHSEAKPAWEIGPDTFEAVLAVYSHEQASRA